jgi:hypothetical protein
MDAALRERAHIDDGFNFSTADELGELIRGGRSMSEGQQGVSP